MKRIFPGVLAVLLCGLAVAVQAAKPTGGSHETAPAKTVVEYAAKTADLSTLAAAIKAASLGKKLGEKGPYTVFAPSNAAFEALPAGTVDMLLKHENKAKLTAVLTYHVVEGSFTADKLAKRIKAGGGKTELSTLNGESLSASMNGDKIALKDAKGGEATVSQDDVRQSNGVIYVIDKVLIP